MQIDAPLPAWVEHFSTSAYDNAFVEAELKKNTLNVWQSLQAKKKYPCCSDPVSEAIKMPFAIFWIMCHHLQHEKNASIWKIFSRNWKGRRSILQNISCTHSNLSIKLCWKTQGVSEPIYLALRAEQGRQPAFRNALSVSLLADCIFTISLGIRVHWGKMFAHFFMIIFDISKYHVDCGYNTVCFKQH